MRRLNRMGNVEWSYDHGAVQTQFLSFPPGSGVDRAASVVLAVGVFDGVHLGHQAVIGQAVEVASELGDPSAVLTFVAHPRDVLRPDQPVPLLSTWREKREDIAALGVDRIIGAHFTQALARMDPEVFVRDILVAKLGASFLVVGYNFRFGHQAAGGPALLRRLSEQIKFGFEEVPAVRLAGNPVSSSEIRRLLATGHLEEANRLLGHPYVLCGKVVGGESRGRRIGFPTANLHVEERKLLPAFGVYAGFAEWSSGVNPCVMNVGISPTFEPSAPRVEAHLLEFDGDLYGQTLCLTFVHYLREEQAFGSVKELQFQIREDALQARQLLGGPEPPNTPPVLWPAYRAR